MPKTSIEWCDYSWPVVNGCRRISAGCGTGHEGGCYAERLAATRLRHNDRYRGLAVMTDKGPQWTGETRLVEKELAMPLKLRKPSRIFVADMGDLFYEGVDEYTIDRVFGVMWACLYLGRRDPVEGHTFQVLTKRAERMRAYFDEPIAALAERWARAAVSVGGGDDPDGIYEQTLGQAQRGPHPRIWLGVSAEDQKTAEQRIPALLDIDAIVHWVSYEPALGPIDFARECDWHDGPLTWLDAIDWIVAGSESGPRARPAELDWFRSVRDQCAAKGTAFFFKQWAVNGRKKPVPELDGRQWMQFPEVRRVA